MAPSIELQKSIYACLSDYYAVYEVVPNNASFPYIQLGEITKTENFTKTNIKRFTFNVMIHGWSKGTSSTESKMLEHFIYQQMTWLFMEQYDVEFVELVMNQNLREEELEETIFHSVQEFEVTLAEIK